MTESKKAWGLLSEACGVYTGRGVNHENQSYDSDLVLKVALENKLLLLLSEARGAHGELFHSEATTIGYDISGQLTMFVTSNNHPGVTPHYFNRIEMGTQGEKKIVFRFGDIADRNSFREEIFINVYPSGELEQAYSWGMAGGEFQARSGAKMQKAKLG